MQARGSSSIVPTGMLSSTPSSAETSAITRSMTSRVWTCSDVMETSGTMISGRGSTPSLIRRAAAVATARTCMSGRSLKTTDRRTPRRPSIGLDSTMPSIRRRRARRAASSSSLAPAASFLVMATSSSRGSSRNSCSGGSSRRTTTSRPDMVLNIARKSSV